MEPMGSASLSGVVEIGDQLCELRPVAVLGSKTNDDDDVPIDLVGASFDDVMGAFANLGREVREVDLVFFRGTKDELMGALAGETGKSFSPPANETITITVIQNGGGANNNGRRSSSSSTTTTHVIKARAGCNLRQILTDNGINVYQSVTRWTNCKGKQLCGTCIVNVSDGGEGTNRKSIDEASTLRENPDSYRLSCVTFAYGDVTVETFPPVKASQWTR
ncbi:hypothetical protein ACHAXA_006057 [Cyclostephanos tholiformis]|uniref:2Fe-2S ferredoxin-type domain-containing protein n=1 Tax=Cyclostephanos tholiformis TaxID=382380 RepID=A0ABD3SB04_9STRA